MKRPKTLSAAFVRTIRQPGIYGDGRGSRGLALRVYRMDNGRVSRRWRQRVRIGGRLTTIALGQYPELSLQDARRQAIENSRTASKGMDPRGDGIPTFAEAAEKVIKLHAKGWRHPERMTVQWRQSLRDYVVPKIGSKPVGKITTADVMAVLTPIWSTKTATARIVRQRLGAVMKWAIAKGYREDNPAGDAITAALPRHNGRTRHHAALPHGEVGNAVGAIQASKAGAATVAAFEVMVLTAARVSEVVLAEWREVDMAARVWTVPASRSKTKRPHRGAAVQPCGGRAHRGAKTERRRGVDLPVPVRARHDPACVWQADEAAGRWRDAARDEKCVPRLGCRGWRGSRRCRSVLGARP